MKLIYSLALLWLLASGNVLAQSTDIETTRMMAEQGDPYAQLYLGYMYDTGKGTVEDDQQAYVWYKKAADFGLPAGQHSLGIMYEEGKVVPQNHLAAYAYFYMAAVQSHDGASAARDKAGAFLTPEKVAHAQKLAIHCIESRYTDCDFHDLAP
jgi:TPR repeat protein